MLPLFAIAGLAGSAVSALGTIASGSAAARAATATARAEALMGRYNAQTSAINTLATGRMNSMLYSSQGRMTGHVAGAEARQLLSNAKLLRMRGDIERDTAAFEAKQMERQGLEELSAAQQEMMAARRQKNLALSRQQAVGASSGFSTSDATSMKLADEVATYGEMQERGYLHQGLSRRDSLETAAAARRVTGSAARSAALAEAKAAAEAAGFTLEGGRISAEASYEAARLSIADALVAARLGIEGAKVAAMLSLSSASQTASATRTAANISAAGTLLGGVAQWGRKNA